MVKEPLQQALDVLSERAVSHTKNIKEKDRQRRNSVIDLYGVEVYRESEPVDGKHEAVYPMAISRDLTYYLRFQFKVLIYTSSATQFSIYVRSSVNTGEKDSEGEYIYRKRDIDITPYLMAEQDGDWIDGENRDSTGDNMFWPNDDLPDNEPSDEPPNTYDLMSVVSMMEAEKQNGDETKGYEADAIERVEMKKIVIKANAAFKGAVQFYPKYGDLNR